MSSASAGPNAARYDRTTWRRRRRRRSSPSARRLGQRRARGEVAVPGVGVDAGRLRRAQQPRIGADDEPAAGRRQLGPGPRDGASIQVGDEPENLVVATAGRRRRRPAGRPAGRRRRSPPPNVFSHSAMRPDAAAYQGYSAALTTCSVPRVSDALTTRQLVERPAQVVPTEPVHPGPERDERRRVVLRLQRPDGVDRPLDRRARRAAARSAAAEPVCTGLGPGASRDEGPSHRP